MGMEMGTVCWVELSVYVTCAEYAKDVWGKRRERTQRHWWPLVGKPEGGGFTSALSYFGTVSNFTNGKLYSLKMYQYVDKCFLGITSSTMGKFFKLEENRVSVIPPPKELLLME